MSGNEAALIVQELEARSRGFKLTDFCFPEQLAFVNDRSRFKTAVCSRRAGKTVGIAADLIDTALKEARMASLYVTLSRLNAKRLIWQDLLTINSAYKMGGEPNLSELTLTMPNRHIIYLSGAKDATEVEKYRGFPLKKVRIDEAQAFRSYLRELVDDVLAKSLYDYNGDLALTGTPSPIAIGYFHECAISGEWSHHAWNMLVNPHLKRKSGRDPMELILEDCKRMGVTIDHPKIQRECFGRWTRDVESLVLTWQEHNHYDALPVGARWSHVLGVDLGYSDADAIACIGWHPGGPGAYLREECIRTKQGISELVAQIGHFIRKYDPQAIVMDTGGLGLKIAEELRRRYSLPIKAAEKQRKFEFLALLNDAMRTRRFFAQRDSRFVQDSFLLEWDRDKTNGDKLIVSDAFHSDVIDAVLYAYREALHWLHRPEVPKPKVGSPEHDKMIVEQMEEDARRQLDRNDDDPANWAPPDLGGDGWGQ